MFEIGNKVKIDLKKIKIHSEEESRIIHKNFNFKGNLAEATVEKIIPSLSFLPTIGLKGRDQILFFFENELELI